MMKSLFNFLTQDLIKRLSPLSVCLILVQCNEEGSTSNETSSPIVDSSKNQESTVSDNVLIDYDNFLIQNNQLGSIKVGMTLKESEEHTQGFKEIESEAFFYGFGGGSQAYEYYYENELLFALIPKLNSDSILFIIGISPNLKTDTGLSPTASIQELLDEYEELSISQDLMSGGENIVDTINNWTFHFSTKPENNIGKYPALDQPYKFSQHENKHEKAVWMVIR